MTVADLLILHSRHAQHPLSCRPNTSDPLVYRQIFIGRAYACLDDVAEASLVIDCGANVGYSSAYFLTRFPGCDLIAVEPDASSFRLLCRNLDPYGKRARAIRSAVWSRPTRLTISETPYRDGREWSTQVRECRPGEADGFLAVDLGGLLSRSGHQRISILKMDVEGAEAVIFSENFEPWIDRVDNIAIELHDDSDFGDASAVFAEAIAGRGFAVDRHKELTVCKLRAS
jgi:FkbM family methyltransferase